MTSHDRMYQIILTHWQYHHSKMLEQFRKENRLEKEVEATEALGRGAAFLLAQSLSTALDSLGETCRSLRGVSQVGLCAHLFSSV